MGQLNGYLAQPIAPDAETRSLLPFLFFRTAYELAGIRCHHPFFCLSGLFPPLPYSVLASYDPAL